MIGSNMRQTPLIVFAFAHERSESNPPVRNLLKEQLQVTSLVAPLVQQKYCETQALVNVNVDRLNELVEREGDRLIGLHYASDVATLLRAREGKEKSMGRALRGKLGRKLGALPHLKWLFLSGDGSQEQAESLIKSGVPLVVRSQNLINDDAAFRLSYFFYQSLGQGLTLGKACERSVSEVRRDYVNKAKLTYEHEPPSGYGSDWPFAYHVNPYVDSPLWWSIHHAKGQAGAGLPRTESRELPAVPFTDFAPLDETYANLFVGKEEVTRSVYEMITTSNAPPIIVLSGAEQSGKSSFVRACLNQVFARDFQYRYCSFEQDALTTLSLALSADEDLSLMRTWVEIEGGEERTLLQPQMITELMNEAQSSFRTHYRSEKADFTQFLRAIRAMWLRDEIGEGDNLLVRLGDLFDQQTKMTLEEEEVDTDIRPLVICIDQIELMFDCNTPLAKRRHERFWEILQQLCYNPDRPLRGGIILCVNSDHVAPLQQVISSYRLAFSHLHLPSLTRREVESFLDRLRTSNSLKEHFPMMIDEQVPTAWGQLLEAVPEEHLGFCFHEMFRQIWRTENKRPLLLNPELLFRKFPKAPTLSSLLLHRVREFTTLMRAQGDEELSDLFALDLLYRMSNQEGDEVDVDQFLKEYLSWDLNLPNPWGRRQKILGDQSLWVITQAIDLGIFRGRVTAGVALPSGILKMVHPQLKVVLEQEWSETLGHYGRAIERMSDYAREDLAPSQEDLRLAEAAFRMMRLPSLEEAETLLKGLILLEENATRSQVSSKRDQLIQLFLIFGLLLTMGRCAQIGSSQEELSSNRGRVDDQLRLLAAERSMAEGEVDLAASLLAEVEEPQKRKNWNTLALKSLNTPLAVSRITSQYEWEQAVITPLALQTESSDGQITLWTGRELRPTQNLGVPSKIDHTDSGQRWVSFEEGMLMFWSIDQEQGTSKRLPQSKIQSLVLNHEGTIATILSDDGVVSAYRSYEYPVKEFIGLNGARIKSMKISPDRQFLMLIDNQGSIQSVNLAEGQVELTIPATSSLNVDHAQWVGGMKPYILVSQKEKTSGNHLTQQKVTLHAAGEEPKTLFQGAASVTRIFTSSAQAQVVLERKGDRGRKALEIYDITDGRSQIKSLPLQGLKVETVVFDPTGNHLLIKPISAKVAPILYAIRDRSQAIELRALGMDTLKRLIISNDGRYVLGQTAENIVEWSSIDGRVLQLFEKRGMNPIAMKSIGRKIQVAFSDAKNRSEAELLSWHLDNELLSSALSIVDEEVTQGVWRENEVITANQNGEISIWDTETRSLRLKFVGHQDRVSVLHLHPSQESFISASADGSVSQWSINEGRAVARLQGHEAGVTAISTPKNPALNRIATGDQSGEVWLWNEQRNAGDHWRASSTRIEHLAFSPQGNYLVTLPAGNREEGAIWKLASGAKPQNVMSLPPEVCVTRWEGQGSELAMLALTKSGDYLRWSPRSGRAEPLADLRTMLGSTKLQSADLHPNGHHILGVSKRGQALLINLKKKTAIPLINSTAIQKAKFVFDDRNDSEVNVILGGKQGKLWNWQDGILVEIGDIQGPVIGLTVSADGSSFLSYSDALAQYWDRPLDQDSVYSRLRKRAKLCLHPRERMKRLDEPLDLAKERYQICRDRVEQLADQYTQ
jgi:WD40 repeat protein